MQWGWYKWGMRRRPVSRNTRPLPTVCFSKVMLQESWSRVCLHSTVRHLTVRDVSYSRNQWLPTRAVHLGSCSTFACCPRGCMCLSSRRPRIREIQPGKWQLENVPTHSLKQNQTLFTAQLPFVFLLLRSVVLHIISSNNFTLAMLRLVWIVATIPLSFPIHGQS